MTKQTGFWSFDALQRNRLRRRPCGGSKGFGDFGWVRLKPRDFAELKFGPTDVAPANPSDALRAIVQRIDKIANLDIACAAVDHCRVVGVCGVEQSVIVNVVVSSAPINCDGST